MSLFERHFIPLVYKAVKSQFDAFLKDFKEHGYSSRSRMETVIINDELYGPIKDLYLTIGSYFADKSTFEEKKGFGLNIDWVNELLKYINSILLQKVILPITETTRNQIREILDKGQLEGWGYEEMARQVEDLPRWRSRLIVRTESVSAMFFGHQVAADKSEFESVDTWIAADDLRTRHSHNVMDNKKVPTGQQFVVPVYKKVGNVDIQVGVDLMKGPGDPDAHIENLANCRCTKVRRLVKDREGNFIRKNSYGI